MKSVSLFLLCLVSLVSCDHANSDRARFNSCADVMGWGDLGCAVCDMIVHNEYTVIKSAMEITSDPVHGADTLISVMFVCDGDTGALDYLTNAEYFFLLQNSR